MVLAPLLGAQWTNSGVIQYSQVPVSQEIFLFSKIREEWENPFLLVWRVAKILTSDMVSDGQLWLSFSSYNKLVITGNRRQWGSSSLYCALLVIKAKYV